jgi:hypothetical protein
VERLRRHAGARVPGGETEDYPVEILPPPHDHARDFGDAPEGIPATSAFIGHYPSCLAPRLRRRPGDRGGVPQSIAPPRGATAGYVEHIASPAAGQYFWFGCGPPGNGDRRRGRREDQSAEPLSTCGQVPVDCVQSAFDQLRAGRVLRDGDAGLATPVEFRACSTSVVHYRAYASTIP